MMSRSEALKRAQGMVESGELKDLDAAQVAIVRMMGVVLVKARMPMAVRRALQAGVRAGEIGHLKKEGRKPEAFFHPNGKANAMSQRKQAAIEVAEALRRVCCPELEIK